MSTKEKLLNIEILDFDYYCVDLKFKNSQQYLKIDANTLENWTLRGLNFSQIILLQIIILAGFRQRTGQIRLSLGSIRGKYGLKKADFGALISCNFIRLSRDIIRDNKIKERIESDSAEKDQGRPIDLASHDKRIGNEKLSEVFKSMSGLLN